MKDDYSLWYIDVSSPEDFDEKTGWWIYYRLFTCSDGTTWPDEVRIDQYYKGEKVSEHKIIVSHMDKVLEICQKMKEHLDKIAPINREISRKYLMGE